MIPKTVPTPAQGRMLMTEDLRNQRPFIHCKIGDGHLEVMHGRGNLNAASRYGERCRTSSMPMLWQFWKTLCQASHERLVYMGSWLHGTHTQHPKYGSGEDLTVYHEQWYRAMTADAAFYYLDYRTLLMQELDPSVLSLWRAIQEDPRPKGLLTSKLLMAAPMLRATPIPIPLPTDPRDPLELMPAVARDIKTANPDVLIMSAGSLAKFAIGDLLHDSWAQGKTLIDIGSGLDPLFLGKTRSVQVRPGEAKPYFRGLL